jgi:hypothetical protein
MPDERRGTTGVAKDRSLPVYCDKRKRQQYARYAVGIQLRRKRLGCVQDGPGEGASPAHDSQRGRGDPDCTDYLTVMIPNRAARH